ncbi:syndecan-like [Pollicipes pollicipes]|uniref:syndecan-like n=1 Tax=Pollicipes pollicipes TaxID=41117 RepID=UPI001884DC9A|nr:syndecan-like [Pollicipes pollicipes]
MNPNRRFVAVLVLVSCAAFALGQAPPDDDDFMFEPEGSGYGLAGHFGLHNVTAAPATSRAAAPDHHEASGSGLYADDEDEDAYGAYEDYDYHLDDDYYDGEESSRDLFDTVLGSDGDSSKHPDHVHEDPVHHEDRVHNVGVVHALPPAARPTEETVPRRKQEPVFGSEVRPPAQTPAPDDTFLDYMEEHDNGITIPPDVTLTAYVDNAIEDDTVHGRPASGSLDGMGAKAVDRHTSFFAQPGILAAVVGGAVVGLLCAILLVMLIVYRMRKKDEGSYPLDEPKRSLTGNTYSKNYNKEFYA